MYLNFWCDDFVRKSWMSLALGACACTQAAASDGPFDVIHPYVGFTESYDANLLGLSNSTQAQQVLGTTNTADKSHTEIGGIALDDQIGLQHLTADISRSKTDFDRFTLLDYQATNAHAPLQNIEKLRQLIERTAPQKRSEFCDALIVALRLNNDCPVLAYGHRAEFVDDDLFTV